MTLRQWLLIALVCLASSLARAATYSLDYASAPQEKAMCKALIHGKFDGALHYCECIRFYNRAWMAINNPADKKYFLKNAIDGCNYVLKHNPPDSYILPEVHLQKGRALSLAGRNQEAMAEFLAAIKGNPRLTLAYVKLADL